MTAGGYVLYRRGDPATSRAAAQAILAQLPTLQQAVYAYAYAQGSHGFTDDEMMAYFRSHRSTYRSRRSELTRAGLIMDTGRTRILPTRRSAIIWAITPPEYIA
jgi:dienelactone hydrolase